MDFFAKLGLLLLVMAVLYLLAHSSRPSDDGGIVPPPPLEPEPASAYDPEQEERAVQPREEGDVRIDNYGFRKIDLRTGPPDPEDFHDELIVHFYSYATGHTWQASYTICTPKGLASMMRETGFSSLLLNAYIVVERYDIDLILKTILEPTEDSPDMREETPRDPDQLRPGSEFHPRW